MAEIITEATFKPSIPDHLRTENPPSQFIRVVYQNGDRGLVETEIYPDTLEELLPIRRLRQELEEIPTTKHGGRRISRRERWGMITTKRRQIDRLTTQLSGVLAHSDPLAPLTVEVNGEVKIVEGEPLSFIGKAFWQFVRESDVWRHVAAYQNGNLLRVKKLFEAEAEYKVASGGADKERKRETEGRLIEVKESLSVLSDDEYTQIEPDIRAAKDYIKKKVA